MESGCWLALSHKTPLTVLQCRYLLHAHLANKKPTTCNRMCDELFGSVRSPISFKTLIHQQLNHSSEIRGNSTCPARHSCRPPHPITHLDLHINKYLTQWRMPESQWDPVSRLYPGHTSKVIKRRGKIGAAKADRWTR